MKQTLRKTLGGLSLAALSATAGAQTSTGPSSSKSPYLVPSATGVQTKAILTAGDVVNGYKMCGTPDGLGAWDNGNGTFTLLVNHEFGNTAGATRAHGSTGTFISKWIINKQTLEVLGGQDLIQRVHLYNAATNSYTVYSASNPSTLAAMGRFCSGDLAPVSAYYNSNNGKGTQERIFLNGEETGSEGRAFAHVATGPNAGSTYELPYLGKFSMENQVACPRMSDTTIVIGTDDATPGQVYVYVGTKKSSGNEITRAGLTGGKLYGVSVSGMLTETNAAIPTANTPFTLVEIDTVQKMTGSRLNSISGTLGITTFLRPEDGAFDPKNPGDFYFTTTNGFNSPSRLWRLRFTNAGNPALGGTIAAVLDGTEGQQMLDNIGIDNFGHIVMVEDVGNNVHLGKIWQYTIATDSLKQIGSHDTTRFLAGGSQFITTDEESSGPIDAQEILGAGWFLIDDQAHKSVGGEVVEDGQILALFNPDTYNSNPEINLQGNTTHIPSGSTVPAMTNNTDFGTVSINNTVTRTYTIQNTGVAPLVVSSISMSGANASSFTLQGTPAFPMTVASGASQTITVRFMPTTVGLHTAKININSNDFDEAQYSVAIQGVGLNASGVASLASGAPVRLYPNPTRETATIDFSLKTAEHLTVSVLDLNGKVMQQVADQEFGAGDQKVIINTNELPSGTYLIQIASGNQSTRMKLSVIH